MRLPSPVVQGQPVSAKEYNALLAYVRMTTVSGGPGVMVNRSPGGTTIRANQVSSKEGPASFAHPFQISASINGSNEAVIFVRYGTVNDVVPVDVATDITRTTAGTYNIYLQNILTDFGVIDESYIVATTSTYTDFDDESVLLLGQVVVVNTSGTLSIGAVNQAATHSLRFNACGRIYDTVGATLEERGIYEYWGF